MRDKRKVQYKMARVQELGKRVREWCKSCERELRKKDVQAVKWLCLLEDINYITRTLMCM